MTIRNRNSKIIRWAIECILIPKLVTTDAIVIDS